MAACPDRMGRWSPRSGAPRPQGAAVSDLLSLMSLCQEVSPPLTRGELKDTLSA